jgi:hypothetical protein
VSTQITSEACSISERKCSSRSRSSSSAARRSVTSSPIVTIPAAAPASSYCIVLLQRIVRSSPVLVCSVLSKWGRISRRSMQSK